MDRLSQRDPRWANIKLGTSDKTIASHGCTITVLAMIIGTTPDVVNARLNTLPKDAEGNTGFAQGNLVYWSRIEEAFPGIKVRRVWSYDNADVLASVPNVIVQVNGAPIGVPMHFVRFVGNKKIHDPWDGQEKPTSTYAVQSYAVLSGKWNKPQEGDYYKNYDLTNKDSMRIAVDVLVRVQSGELVDKSQITQKDQRIKELGDLVLKLQDRLSRIKGIANE